jgi:hypothetical protein
MMEGRAAGENSPLAIIPAVVVVSCTKTKRQCSLMQRTERKEEEERLTVTDVQKQ